MSEQLQESECRTSPIARSQADPSRSGQDREGHHQGEDTIKGNEYTYHKDFEASTGQNDVVLQSSDGTDFHFDGSYLGHLSSFFHDIASLPAPNGAMAFPHISTDGLCYVLSCVRNLTTGLPTPRPDLAQVPEILDFIKTYDLPAVGLHLATAYHAMENYDPLVVFAIAACAQDEKLVAKIAKETRIKGIDSMPDWTIQVLEERNPRSLVKLFNYLVRRREPSKRASLLHDLKHPSIARTMPQFLVCGPMRVYRCQQSWPYTYETAATNIGARFEVEVRSIAGIIGEESLNNALNAGPYCNQCKATMKGPMLARIREYQAQCEWR